MKVLHGKVAYPAQLVDPEVDDPTIISGPYGAVPLSQLRSGADQDATNDDRPNLLSLSPKQEEDRGPGDVKDNGLAPVRRKPRALPAKPQEPPPVPPVQAQALPPPAQPQALPDRKTEAVKDAAEKIANAIQGRNIAEYLKGLDALSRSILAFGKDQSYAPVIDQVFSDVPDREWNKIKENVGFMQTAAKSAIARYGENNYQLNNLLKLNKMVSDNVGTSASLGIVSSRIVTDGIKVLHELYKPARPQPNRPGHEVDQAPRPPSPAWKRSEKGPDLPGYPKVEPVPVVVLGRGRLPRNPFDLFAKSLQADGGATARRLLTKPSVSNEPRVAIDARSIIYDADAPEPEIPSIPHILLPPSHTEMPLSKTERRNLEIAREKLEIAREKLEIDRRELEKSALKLLDAIDDKDFVELFSALRQFSNITGDDRNGAVAAVLENRAVNRDMVQAIEGTVFTLWAGLERSKRFDAEERIEIDKIFSTWSSLNRNVSGLAALSSSAKTSDLNAAKKALSEMFRDQDPDEIVLNTLKT